MRKFTVESYDAFDSPDERRCLKEGEFDTEEEAVNLAKKIIDTFLINCYESGSNWDEAYEKFCNHGEIPMVFGEPKPDFHAYEYAKSKVEELNKGLNKQLFE